MQITNPLTKKSLKISRKQAEEFFGITGTETTVICMPTIMPIEELQGQKVVVVSKVHKVKKKKHIPGTLVIRMGGLGDLIMLSSSLANWKMRHRKKQLTVATAPQNMEYAKSLPFVDRCLSTLEHDKYTFDEVIDLRFAVEPEELGSHCKSDWMRYTQMDRSDDFDMLMGVYPSRKRFCVPVDEKIKRLILGKYIPGPIHNPIIRKHGNTAFGAIKDLRDVQAELNSRKTKLLFPKILILNASMVAPARSIPVKYVLQLCNLTERHTDFHIVLVGVSQTWNKVLLDIKGNRITNLIDKTSYKELVALISIADLIVTPDTGTLHISGALGRPTIGLFGNINPRARISYYPSVKALYPHGEKKCIPCGDLHPCLVGKSEDGTACMALLTPTRIVEAIIKERKCI